MEARDSFRQELPIEISTDRIKLWYGTPMKPFNDLIDLGCNRIRINKDTLEFDCGRETIIFHLSEEVFFISHPRIFPDEINPN